MKLLELSSGFREISQYPEKATWSVSLLKGPNSAFKRHYAKLALTLVSDIETLVRKDQNTMKFLIPLTTQSSVH